MPLGKVFRNEKYQAAKKDFFENTLVRQNLNRKKHLHFVGQGLLFLCPCHRHEQEISKIWYGHSQTSYRPCVGGETV